MKFPKTIRIEPVKTHDEIEFGIRPKKFQKKQYKKNTIAKSKPIYFSKPKKSRNTSSKLINTSNGIKQNCNSIVHYHNSKAGHFANLFYIQNDAKGKDGTLPELYGNIKNEEEYKNNADEKYWTIIIAPQENNIDLNALTKTFIEKLEEETGYKFSWCAANHYNTDHYHTHLLINGKDKNGKDVVFLPREKVGYLMRQYLCDICTKMIGHRTENQIEQDYEKMENKSYYTKLDKALTPMIDENNVLSRAWINHKRQKNFTKRLEYLENLGLCKFQSNTRNYVFKNNWIEELKLLGKYNTYYDGYNYADCTPENYYLHDPKKDGKINGEIKKIYTMQKDSNNFAVVIKTKDGKGAYVPLNMYPNGCHPGDIIKIETKDKRMYINNYSRKK